MVIFRISVPIVHIPKPIKPRIRAITMKNTTVSMLIARAISHPQSKKCFTSASQTISCIILAIMPVNIAENIEPKRVPIKIIQIASVNFAFSFPTSALPASHKTGESMIVGTITFMTRFISSSSKLIAKLFPPII